MRKKRIKDTDIEAAIESLDSGWCLSDESHSVFVDGRKQVIFTNSGRVDVSE